MGMVQKLDLEKFEGVENVGRSPRTLPCTMLIWFKIKAAKFVGVN